MEVCHKMGNQTSAEYPNLVTSASCHDVASAFFTSANGYPGSVRSGMIEIRPRPTLEGEGTRTR